MEFDSSLNKIQGTFLSCEKKLGSLKSLKFEDEKEATVVETLRKVIEQITPKHNNIEVRRKIHLYLVLNTNFPIQESLYEDDSVAHLLNTMPLLSPSLLVAIVRGCNLVPFMCETLTYCEPALSVQYMDAFLQYSENLNAPDLILETFKILPAIFLRIVRLNNDIEKFSTNNKVFLMKKFCKAFRQMIVDLTPLLSKRFISSDQLFIMEMSGKVTKNMISLVMQCMNHMSNPKPLDWYPEPVLLEHDYSEWGETDGEGDSSAMSCFDFITEKCNENMQSVTLDIWMHWEGCPGYTDDKHLQSEIAEEAYFCSKKETSIASEKLRSFRSTLLGFESKPLDETDEIKIADLSKIISCISDENKTQTLWLEALLQRNDGLSTIEALETIKGHLDLLNIDMTYKLMNLAVAGNSADDTMLKELAFEAFQNNSLSDQYKLLEDFFTQHKINDTFKTSSFDATLTSVLNRSSNLQTRREKWLLELLSLCLQSPAELVQHIVMAGVASRSHGTVMCSALDELRAICSLKVETEERTTSLLLHALAETMSAIDPATSQITHLVMLLEDKGLVNNAEYIRTCVMPALTKDLTDYKVLHIQLWLQLLRKLLKVDTPQQMSVDCGLNLSAILTVLAEVLQRASWVLGKFRQQESLLRADTVLLVRPLACKMANTCESDDKELLWLRSGLLKLTSHNRSHFSPLWTHFGMPVPSMNLGALLLSRDAMYQQSNIPPCGPDQLLSPLLILLPTCCTPEWRLLASSLSALLAYHKETVAEDEEEDESSVRSEEQMLPEMLRLLVTTLMLQALMLSQQQPDDQSFSNDCALACLENSVRNLGIVMKEEWLPRLNGVDVVEAGAAVVRQVALLLRSLPATLAGSCSLALSGVLVQAQEVLLVQAAPSPNLATWCAHELALSLALLPDRESRQALSRKLLLEPALAQL